MAGIQIQHLLKLNVNCPVHTIEPPWIQIQHLLKLNHMKHYKIYVLIDSNTTLVKVKLVSVFSILYTSHYSNTTLVKVKCYYNATRFGAWSIQIQHLLKLN